MKNDINGLIFCGVVFTILLILGFVLRSGHGALLIGGYNILPKESKALFNEKKLCRFFGNLLFFADILIILAVLAGINEITWLVILIVFIMITISFAAIIYAFTSKRFRNQ